MTSLTDEQLIFLDNIIYLDFEQIVEKYSESNINVTVRILVNELLENIDTLASEEPASMPQEEWRNLLTYFSELEINQEFLNDYVIDTENYKNESSEEGAFRAYCFVKRDEGGAVEDVVAIFRGTAGDAIEWEDNILNAARATSEEMDKSCDYINGLPSEYGDNITVSGHSKGYNKILYSTQKIHISKFFLKTY